jgi:hypothetical protein
VGIELLTIDAHIVVASVDTYLRFAEAVNRVDLTEKQQRPYASGMTPELIAGLASVVVIVITVMGQWFNSRNDRQLTNLELDIWKKLDPNSRRHGT